MKIGNFSNLFNVPITTIRYYIENDILLPLKRNSQYIFTETDAAEMEIILNLKSLSFSTEEIKQFLQIIRVYNLGDERINQHIIKAYEDKKNKLEEEKKSVTKAINTIDKEIRLYKRKSAIANNGSGIPLSFLEYMACPHCNRPLDMNHLKITHAQIISGCMNCSCGYNSVIYDGVILANSDTSFYNSPEFKIQHFGADKDLDDFVFFENLRSISEEAIALNLKASTWIDSVIKNNSQAKRIIYIPDLACHFLYKNIDSEYFKNSLIVVTGFTKEAIKGIKSHIDHIQNDLEIIYIANTIYDIPMKKNIFDMWVDFISSYNFSFFHDKTLHELVSSYFKEGALLAGLTKYMDPNSESFKYIRQRYSNAHEDNSKLPAFLKSLKDNGWTLQKEEKIGAVKTPGPYYDYMINHEEQDFLCYHAIKKNITSGED